MCVCVCGREREGERERHSVVCKENLRLWFVRRESVGTVRSRDMEKKEENGLGFSERERERETPRVFIFCSIPAE